MPVELSCTSTHTKGETFLREINATIPETNVGAILSLSARKIFCYKPCDKHCVTSHFSISRYSPWVLRWRRGLRSNSSQPFGRFACIVSFILLRQTPACKIAEGKVFYFPLIPTVISINLFSQVDEHAGAREKYFARGCLLAPVDWFLTRLRDSSWEKEGLLIGEPSFNWMPYLLFLRARPILKLCNIFIAERSSQFCCKATHAVTI